MPDARLTPPRNAARSRLLGIARTALAGGALAFLLVACSGRDDAALAAAQGRLERGEVDAAVIEVKALLQRRPQDAAARLLLGRALFAQGELAAAESELRRARDAGAREADVLPLLARTMLEQHRASDVVEQFRVASFEPAEQLAALRVQVALAHVVLGEPTAASRANDEALALAPGHVGALALAARLQATKGDEAGALQATTTLVQRFAHDAEAWLVHGDALAGRDPAGALAAYERAVALDPGLVQAQAALIMAHLRQGRATQAQAQIEAFRKTNRGRAAADYYEALLAYASGDLYRARGLNQQLLQGVATNPHVLLLAGMTELRLGTLASAETYLVQATARLPDAVEPRRELAALWVQRGQPARALEQLRRLLRREQGDARTWLVAGQAHTLLGDFRAADEAFARAAALRPDDAQVRTDRAHSLIVRGQYEAGLRELNDAGAETATVETTLMAIAALMGRGDSAGALKAVDRLAQRHPDVPGVDLVRGRIHEARGALAPARTAYERALQRNPAFVPAIERLAALDLAEDRIGAARARYEALLAREPRQTSAMLAMAHLARLGGEGRAAARAWLDRAVAVHPADPGPWLAAIAAERSMGDEHAALARAQRAAAAVHENAEVLAALGDALRATGDAHQARATYVQAVALQPDDADLRLRLAQAFIEARDHAAADTQLVLAAKANPDSAPVARARVLLALIDERPDIALSHAQRRQETHPREADGWMMEAEVHARQRRWPEAVAAARRAVAIDARSDVAIALYRHLDAAGDAAARDAFARERLVREPRDAAFVGFVAQRADARGEHAEAEARYRQAIALQPDSPLLHNNLAMLLLARRPAEALQSAERAAKLAPDVPPVLDTLARAQAAGGQLRQAIATQTRAVELASRAPGLRLQLARLHLQAGDRTKAREVLATLGDAAREGPLAEEARRLNVAAGG